MPTKLDPVKQGLSTTQVVASNLAALAGAAFTIITIGEITYNGIVSVMRRRQAKRINEAMALNVISLKPPLAPHPDQDNLMAG
jgi:hypothetical protein